MPSLADVSTRRHMLLRHGQSDTFIAGGFGTPNLEFYRLRTCILAGWAPHQGFLRWGVADWVAREGSTHCYVRTHSLISSREWSFACGDKNEPWSCVVAFWHGADETCFLFFLTMHSERSQLDRN